MTPNKIPQETEEKILKEVLEKIPERILKERLKISLDYYGNMNQSLKCYLEMKFKKAISLAFEEGRNSVPQKAVQKQTKEDVLKLIDEILEILRDEHEQDYSDISKHTFDKIKELKSKLSGGENEKEIEKPTSCNIGIGDF